MIRKPRAFDFRTAIPAVGLWLGMLLTFGVLCDVKAVSVFALVGICTVLFAAKRRRPLQTLLILCSIFGVLLVTVRVHAILNDDVRVLISNPLSTEITFLVADDPRLQASTGFGALGFDKEIAVAADIIRIDDQSISFPVYLISPVFDGLLEDAEISSKWNCRARLTESTGIRRSVAFAKCISAPIPIGSATNQQHIASVVRMSLQKMTSGRHPNDDGAALLPGLVVGDTSAQSSELENDLQDAGLGHLTAVSGANVAIVIAACEFMLRRTRLRRSTRIALLGLAVMSFVVIARPSPSVVRAAAMALLTLWVWFRGSQRHSEIIVFISCSLLLVVDPWLAASWGFALSVAATLGLIILPRWWGVSSTSSFALKAMTTALAAGVATLPLLVAMGSSPTFASIPANVLAEIFVAPATIAGVLTAVIASLGALPFIGEFIAPLITIVALVPAEIGVWCARAIVAIARLANQSIFNVVVVSTTGVMLLLLTFVTIYILKRYSRLNIRAVFLILICGTLLLWSSQAVSKWMSRWPPPQWEVIACDVGQGDATVIRLASHSAMVIDVGGDPDLLDRCLDDVRIETVEVFIASHFHADHVGGVAGLPRGREVHRVVVGTLEMPRGGLELVRQTFRDTQLEVAFVGMSDSYQGEFGEVTWSVLQTGISSVATEADGTAINNQSVVVLVSTPHMNVLLTGDIEIAAQTSLMAAMSPLHVDVVKVPHHGSKSQEPAFARWSGARLAWISVGADNAYGHPSREAITYYKSAGMVVLTTADCGDIAVLQAADLGFAPRDECRSV